MPLRVLIVPDKFKGTLTARNAANAIARGWLSVRPDDRLDLLPLSDGGDGFGKVLGDLLQAQVKTVRTVDAAHRPCAVKWWWEPGTKTAIIESAAVIGLAKLSARGIHFDSAAEAPPLAPSLREARAGRDVPDLCARTAPLNPCERTDPSPRPSPLPKGRGGIVASISAKAGSWAGLPKTDPFHPFQLDTFGLGAVLRAAAAHGATRCLLGLGGSATNDGGFGLARALGWEFLDDQDNAIEQWTRLGDLRHIQRSAKLQICADPCLPPRKAAPKAFGVRALRSGTPRPWFHELCVAVDVQNPLLGPRGATRVYGPQKGLRQHDFEQAERCLRRLARVVKKQFGHDLARVPGAGAAGGLGFGLLAFLGARLEPGFDLFARLAGLERRLRSADLVITGEGVIDDSSLMGKGVGRIAQRCRELGVPCLGLAGAVTASAANRSVFTQTHALLDLTDLKQAKGKPALWLERLAAKAAACALLNTMR